MLKASSTSECGNVLLFRGPEPGRVSRTPANWACLSGRMECVWNSISYIYFTYATLAGSKKRKHTTVNNPSTTRMGARTPLKLDARKADLVGVSCIH